VRPGGFVPTGQRREGVIDDRLRLAPGRLVGRERERAALDRLLASARQGLSGSLVIRGGAGVGKTTLLGYAADSASGMMVLRVTGVRAEYDLAFAGIHALLWPIVDELRQLPEPQRSALAAALGMARGEGRDRFLVSAGVLSLLAAAAESGPILCLVDDAQWLDVPSADALVFTARRLVAEGLVILFCAREGEPHGFEGTGLEDLMLGGLDRESAMALLSRSSPHAVASVRWRLLAEAAGNPLALLELSGALSDAQLAGRAPMPQALPLTARLHSTFLQHVKRLPDATRAALLVAAADDTGELDVIRRAAAQLALPEDALVPAQEAGIVTAEADTLTFRHPLVRSAVYESAALGLRHRAHAALAGALAGAQRADRALWHRAMATDEPDEEIAGALQASAEESQQRGGHASAASALERAAMLSETESARGGRLAAAANAAYMAGQLERAGELVSRSLVIAQGAERARLLGLSGVIKGLAGSLQDGITTLLEAIALSEDASLSLELLREACTMATYVGDLDQLTRLCLRAAELSPVTDADRFIVAVLMAAAAELEGDFLRAHELLADATELAERLDDARCLISVAPAAGRAGSWGDGLPYANRAVRIARERGLVSTLPSALQAQASQLLGQSQFDLAYASAEEGRRLALDSGQHWAAAWNLADLLTVDSLRGAEEQFRARLVELEAIVASSGGSLVRGRIARALGMLELGLGRPSEALAHLLVSIDAVRLESNPLVVLGVPDAVEAALRAQRLGEVTDHLDRFQKWVERFPNPARLALLARCGALVTETDAEQHFVQAIELAEALPSFERARTELLYGEWLRRHRRRRDARPLLRAAMERFQRLGVSPWEERARSELRASGETARRRDPSTRDQLTPQELQIARLVAEGMTNPEVATQLFLSPRTIDYHLRKVFTKLEISSRGELANVDLGEPVIA
jgi:DNA-binding CsgD family transcriptional regulator